MERKIDLDALATNLMDELWELREKQERMRRFAKLMEEEGDPVLRGFAYQIQVILNTRTSPMPPAPEVPHVEN